MSTIGRSPVFMLVAGELSGDQLGGGLIKMLKSEYRDARFFGVGGPNMIAEGLETIVPLETLSVMGLSEVLKHLPKLIRLKNELVRLAKEHHPIAFIGIDSPDFNLRLAKSLKQQKITLTFQYVSPSIWVWREGRAKTIKKYIDRVLCLFPFEVDIYKKYQVDAVCVGHRLGDEIPLSPSVIDAKQSLQLSETKCYLAILPGSRMAEIERLFPVFLESVTQLACKNEGLDFIIPAASEHIFSILKEQIESLDNPMQERITLFNGKAREVMQASNAVLLTSGTVSLEAMLLKKPMVVAYRFNAFTAWLAPKIVNIKYFSLPNILAKKQLVPELFQQEVTVENIVNEVMQTLDQKKNNVLIDSFYTIHQSLRLNSDKAAAQAIIEKLAEYNLQ